MLKKFIPFLALTVCTFAAITASADQLFIRYFAVDSYGGGWEVLCEWTVLVEGKIDNVSADCKL